VFIGSEFTVQGSALTSEPLNTEPLNTEPVNGYKCLIEAI